MPVTPPLPPVQRARQRPLALQARSGRLYVSGPAAGRVLGLPGAARNLKLSTRAGTPVVELSLTLDTLSAIRRTLGVTGSELAACCDETVMRWAKAAHATEQSVTATHQRLGAGMLREFPWVDNRDGLPPYSHQRVMATAAVEIPGCAFLCEMGTGKTRGAAEAASFMIRAGVLDGCIIVCPNSVTGTWVRELRRWATNLDPRRLAGTVADRVAELARLFPRDEGRATRGACPIINYEVLDKMKHAIMAAAHNAKIGIIFDEGHRIRRPTTKVTKAAMEIAAQMRWRLLMTGTPIVNGVENIWSQWYVIDLGMTFGANFVQFRREFFDENPYTHKLDPLAETTTEVNRRIRRRGIRFTKAECLDLPPKIYEVLECDMGREQLQAYRDMEETLVVEFERLEREAEGASTAAIQLTMLLRLAQITSGYLPNTEDPEGAAVYRFPSVPKIELLEETVREQVGAGAQVLIWAVYRENYKMIEERVGDLGLVKIVGGMTSAERDAAEESFQRGDARIFLGHPGAGGVGLNLQAGSVAMYYSQGYNLDYRLQSEDRCHRSGSEIHNRVLYLDLQCRGSIDQAISQALAGKLSVAHAVTEFRRQIGV